MGDAASSTTTRPAIGTSRLAEHRTRMNRSAVPQIPALHDEPICNEPFHGPDDVLLSGSDDEYYDSPVVRCWRLEEQARLFLEGRRPNLLSASLRGPFGRDSGWENPWKGNGAKVSKRGAAQTNTRAPRAQRASIPSPDASTHSRSQALTQPADIVPATAATAPASASTELGTTPSLACSEKDAAAKKRTSNTGWLRRRNLKRMKRSDEDLLTPSPSAARSIRAANIPMASRASDAPEATKTPALTRSFSAPAKNRAGGMDEDRPSGKNFDGASCPGSHIPNSKRPTSVPSDHLWESSDEFGRASASSTSRSAGIVQERTICSGANAASHAVPQTTVDEARFESQRDDSFYFKKRVSTSICGLGPGSIEAHESRDNVSTELDDTTLLSAEQVDGKDAAAHLLSSELSTTGQCLGSEDQSRTAMHSEGKTNPDGDIPRHEEPVLGEVQSDAAPGELSDDLTTGHFADATATTCVVDDDTDQETAPCVVEPSGSTDEVRMGDERLASQDQSPWVRTQSNAAAGTSDTDSEATVDRDNSRAGCNENRGNADVPTAQSPWSKEDVWQHLVSDARLQHPPVEKLEKPKQDEKEDAEPRLSIATPNRPTLQNPWAEENGATSSASSSLPNLPTSPPSPDQDTDMPRPSSEQQEEPSLPSLPIAIVPSSGTAPSTPETKQSSLPTPDLTMSIKPFRIFRSPTPTPPPRRRRTVAGGPRSILKQCRRKSGATTSASKPDRRVHFNLPSEREEPGSGVSRPDASVGDTSGADDGEEDYIEAGLSHTSRGRKYTFLFQSSNATPTSRPTQRTASPPPQDRTLVESLPSEVDRFQCHFASVAGRTQGALLPASTCQSVGVGQPASGTIVLSRTGAAKSHAVYSSPSVDAMASRFLDADAESSKLQQITCQQSLTAVQRPRSGNAGNKLFSAHGGDKENVWGQEGESTGGMGEDAGGDDDAASAVDDVQEVMDNLDDFLGMWDVDAELAQVRAGRL